MSIGSNIKKFRKENKLTQVELATRAGISRSYLADVEGDRYNPSVEVLQLIANALDITVSAILGEENADKSVDEIEEEMKKIYPKIKQLSKKDRIKVLKMIDVLLEENDIDLL